MISNKVGDIVITIGIFFLPVTIGLSAIGVIFYGAYYAMLWMGG
jgi:hypothetical protein